MIDMWMSKTALLTSALAVMFLTSSDNGEAMNYG